jgi:hypothetical protein
VIQNGESYTSIWTNEKERKLSNKQGLSTLIQKLPKQSPDNMLHPPTTRSIFTPHSKRVIHTGQAYFNHRWAEIKVTELSLAWLIYIELNHVWLLPSLFGGLQVYIGFTETKSSSSALWYLTRYSWLDIATFCIYIHVYYITWIRIYEWERVGWPYFIHYDSILNHYYHGEYTWSLWDITILLLPVVCYISLPY